MITGKFPSLRLRRSRKSDWSRRLVQENNLTPNDFILPIFLIDGKNKKQSIKTMPDVYRYTLDRLSSVVDKAIKKGLPMIALFPYTEKKKKNTLGTEALNEDNLVCKAIQLIKKKYNNEIGIMCDVALDPYTSHGHDGLLKSGYVLNDERDDIFYDVCHINHPCTVWARQSRGNYEWLYTHFLALGMEYTYRYGKEHASITKLAKPLMKSPKNIHQGDMTPLAQAMPDKYKDDNPVKAYRNYVIHEKHYAEWNQNREKPLWWR